MGADSKIEWTHHTFNPWRGCTKVSDGCKNCYAESMSRRNLKVLGQWGPNGTRVVASESMWREPLKWDAAAKAVGERHRVFCASLADVFEGADTMPKASWGEIEAARLRLWDLIYKTKNLNWLLLTKRPENVADVIGGESGAGLAFMEENMRNVWLGTSVENQEQADKRIPHLLRCPAAVRFLSMEPLLGPVDLARTPYPLAIYAEAPGVEYRDGLTGTVIGRGRGGYQKITRQSGIDWVIVGGESGHGARPCHMNWIREIARQCKAASVSCFIKQLGARPQEDEPDEGPKWPVPLIDGNFGYATPVLGDSKGGDWDEWPEDLRVRQFPKVEAQ